ncbi:MAG: hypothetical protein IJD28_00240 [Deferribacterales bacterium]|nr:hypothetical protein [Deferribacterales bacterium]
MDRQRFQNLSNIAKIDYVIIRLEHARGLMQIIYDSGLPLSNSVLAELESLGDDFAAFGVAAETGQSDYIFDELNAKIAKLENIANNIQKLVSN